MLKIRLNSPVPIYEQLVVQITDMIKNGELKPGDELPSIRSLASQLDVANNTVGRAYMELERQGTVVSNGRKGTFIRELDAQVEINYEKIFKESIIKLLQAGLDEKTIRRIFRQNLDEIFK